MTARAGKITVLNFDLTLVAVSPQQTGRARKAAPLGQVVRVSGRRALIRGCHRASPANYPVNAKVGVPSQKHTREQARRTDPRLPPSAWSRSETAPKQLSTIDNKNGARRRRSQEMQKITLRQTPLHACSSPQAAARSPAATPQQSAGRPKEDASQTRSSHHATARAHGAGSLPSSAPG
jgi:hypothetical protein